MLQTRAYLSMIFNTSSSFYSMHIIPNHSRASPFGVNSFWNLWNLFQYVETNRKHSNIKIADSSDYYCYARKVSAYCIVYNGDCTQTLALHSTSSLSCLLLQSSRVFHSFRHIGKIPQTPEVIDSKRKSPAVGWDDLHAAKSRRCIKNHRQMHCQ